MEEKKLIEPPWRIRPITEESKETFKEKIDSLFDEADKIMGDARKVIDIVSPYFDKKEGK